MKKILSVLFAIIFTASIVQAKTENYKNINFYGQKYKLLYSSKNSDLGSYLNEYFKNGETYNTWSEMVSVHYFPNAYSPIDQVRQFREFLNSINCPSSLTFDDKKNTAMIDFVMINSNQNPVVIEFNVFKYYKSPVCGSAALQYSKRYAVTNEFQAEAVKSEIEKYRKRNINRVKKYPIPEIELREIDLCKFPDDTFEKKHADVIIKDKEDALSKEENDAKKEENTETDESSSVVKKEHETSVTVESAGSIDSVDDFLNADESEKYVFSKNELEKEFHFDKDALIPVSEKVNKSESNKDETTETILKKQEPMQEKVSDISKKKNTEETTTKKSEEIIQENTNKKDLKKKKAEKIKQEKQKKEKVKKVKTKKEKTYQIVNDKSDLYQKEPVKKIKKEKNVSKKEKKERAKNASKKLEE